MLGLAVDGNYFESNNVNPMQLHGHGWAPGVKVCADVVLTGARAVLPETGGEPTLTLSARQPCAGVAITASTFLPSPTCDAVPGQAAGVMLNAAIGATLSSNVLFGGGDGVMSVVGSDPSFWNATEVQVRFLTQYLDDFRRSVDGIRRV